MPLEAQHVEAAADLLSRAHGEAAERSGWVSSVADRAVARDFVEASRLSGPAVVAMEGSSPVGFTIVPLPGAPGPGARWNDRHHASEPDRARDAYRHMYAAVASRLVAAGCFNHSVAVLSSSGAVEVFFELGFGVDQIKGFRPVESGAGVSAGDVRPAVDDDLDALVELSTELLQFHSTSPILRPSLPGGFDARRELQRAVDEDGSTVLVAEQEGSVVAMIEAERDGRYPDTVEIGMNVVTEQARSSGVGTVMLNALMSWAVEEGYKACGVSWSSANLLSDAFYRARGFVPHRYRLARLVDSRIAWANERLDYRQFADAGFPGARR